MASATENAPEIDLSDSIREFAGQNSEYYCDRFKEIQSSTDQRNVINWAVALLGPLWAAARGVWSVFWIFIIFEIIALVQLGRGLWGDLGASKAAEANQLQQKAEEMFAQGQSMMFQGDATAESSMQIAVNLQKAAQTALLESQLASETAWIYIVVGFVAFAVLRGVQSLYANRLYEAHYSRWRVNRSTPSDVNLMRLGFGVVLTLIMAPLSLYRFTVSKPASWTLEVPIDKIYFISSSNWLDGWFDRSAESGKGVFDGITSGAQWLLDGVEVLFVDSPWPVVIIFLLVLAWQLAGIRVAIFTAAALAYIGFMGFWEASMVSIVMVGASAIVCVVIGVPLGIWFSRSDRAYTVAQPILDLMQTVPAFVYLIPIIAFFGTGKVPGVLATIIFAMPPVVRLTALGMRQVPEHVKEAARAFGATEWQVLRGIELPLSTPAIMTGVNQTILMCLSMVVIASLIGAKGLGQEVLTSLQYVAKGEGILAGLAILFCAMMLDRIVQGKFKREELG